MGATPLAKGCALNKKDRAPLADAERTRDRRVRRDRLKTVFRFYQRHVVLLFEQEKNGFDFQIVLNDLFPDFARQVSLVEGNRNIVRKANTLNAHHAGTGRQRKVASNGLAGRYDFAYPAAVRRNDDQERSYPQRSPLTPSVPG